MIILALQEVEKGHSSLKTDALYWYYLHHKYHPHPKDGEGNVFTLSVSSSPRRYPNPWSHVPSWGGGGVPLGQDHSLARTGVCLRPGLGYPPPQDRLRCERYASCSFPQEDFLVLGKLFKTISLGILPFASSFIRPNNKKHFKWRTGYRLERSL